MPDGDDRTYLVVYNHEEQYSIWDAGRDLPAGWTAEGTAGSREHCLSRIGEVWTDLRPLSLRRRMDAGQPQSAG
ncbi:MbtH family protein [Amycolatopsis magusensis]|uniref:MbtH protein n=1 Tax=Amycolatopsis magusensis TaxID=882444 RepID=A0ABS4PWC2_9PSEU|nr:MbtH family NRPS accessory protein [Amycolatopsis magusensis]MBP2183598.1 MbtH protein [Amycolatopsis magusensis]MDI5982062.1 MbtH family NRPS accessory protein [Amycolatopsis magusensis]